MIDESLIKSMDNKDRDLDILKIEIKNLLLNHIYAKTEQFIHLSLTRKEYDDLLKAVS